MKTSLKAYLDSLDLTAEEKATFAPILANEKVTGAIDKELSGAQSEISRRFDEAKAQGDRNTQYYQELQNFRTSVEAQLADARKAVEDGKVLTTRMQERLRSKVADGTLGQEDFDDLIKASDANDPAKVTPTRQAPPAAEPNTNYLNREDFEKFERGVVSFVPAMMAIASKHQELFGKPAPADLIATLPTEAAKANKTLMQYAAETFKFSEREQALAAEQQKANEDRIRLEERQKVMSEMSNPTNRPQSANNSPVLRFSTPEKTTVDNQNHRARGVMAAIEAHRNHKYAGDQPA